MADGRVSAAARAIALAGPAGAGKTTLMEALLFRSGAITRQGGPGSTVGDHSPEARAHGHSVEPSVASFEFMGDRYGVIDCPGSVEFSSCAEYVLPAVDLVLVVADPSPDKAALLQPVMKELERTGTPHALFVNKIDQAHGDVRELLKALQSASTRPLVARQMPIQEGEQVRGFVDLALERAFIYRPGKESEQIEIPGDVAQLEADERFHMLEQLADHDDNLMEELLSDIVPPRDEVFADLVKETREGLIVPVFLGSALNGFGIGRLLKALRHDLAGPEAAAERVGASGNAAYVFMTSHAGQAGKLAYARVLSGRIADGAEMTRGDGEAGRVGGVFSLLGAQTRKIAAAETGEVVALGKVENAGAGDLLSADGKSLRPLTAPEAHPPVFALAIAAKDRKDDVRLSSALHKLLEEDPSLRFEHDPAQHETLLLGRGEGHLKVALERLKRRYGVEATAVRPKTPYKETIRKGATQRGRHKKQTGGHGQFGDVVIEVKPLPRGSGFQFESKITGGVVPRQWIPAVEDGVTDAMEKGPLGFPVVDVAVALTDGSYHAVDSSELAFRTAGRIGMSEALEKCDPILLEPIEKVTIHAPNTATSRINSTISSRRGQILGFDAREDWPGWDRIEVYLPQSERHDLIVELRSMTQGLGGFEAEFDHMAEVTGRTADEIVKGQKAAV
ncbi:MAG TPA: elongation factor G [Caulobacteraceae bacterium]|jgi:elongation factor G